MIATSLQIYTTPLSSGRDSVRLETQDPFPWWSRSYWLRGSQEWRFCVRGRVSRQSGTLSTCPFSWRSLYRWHTAKTSRHWVKLMYMFYKGISLGVAMLHRVSPTGHILFCKCQKTCLIMPQYINRNINITNNSKWQNNNVISDEIDTTFEKVYSRSHAFIKSINKFMTEYIWCMAGDFKYTLSKTRTTL